MNQTESNDFNEQEIVEKSKIAQLGKFNDIDKGNSSTIFYGGIVFPSNFDYDDGSEMTCTQKNCTNMNYKIRFIQDYTVTQTDSVYSHTAGPGESGIKIYLYSLIFTLMKFKRRMIIL